MLFYFYWKYLLCFYSGDPLRHLLILKIKYTISECNILRYVNECKWKENQRLSCPKIDINKCDKENTVPIAICFNCFDVKSATITFARTMFEWTKERILYIITHLEETSTFCSTSLKKIWYRFNMYFFQRRESFSPQKFIEISLLYFLSIKINQTEFLFYPLNNI